jgi:serine protease Do
VIEGADEILIEFRSGIELEAELIGTDPNTDIALLKVEADDALPFVPFGDSEIMRVGDWVMAMGNPLGQGFSVSVGVVSARERALSGTYDDYIQTDAAINRGNSGGPLFNMAGEVIGVNTAILSPTGGSIGIGFAMSASVVTNVVDQLREFGETRRGWLGVRIQDVMRTSPRGSASPMRAARWSPTCPRVPRSMPGSRWGRHPQLQRRGDRGHARACAHRGRIRRGRNRPHARLPRGETQTLLVTLGRRETAEGAAPAASGAEPEARAERRDPRPHGRPSDRRDARAAGRAGRQRRPRDRGCRRASDAASKGLQVGDIITEVAQQPVRSVADFSDRVAAAEEAGQKSILLLIRRAGNPRFVALALPNKRLDRSGLRETLAPVRGGFSFPVHVDPSQFGGSRPVGEPRRFVQPHQIVQQVRHILHPFRHHVADTRLPLDPARDLQKPPRDHRAAEGQVDLLPHDHIGHPELILQRQEDHPLRRAGPLPHQHQPRHADPRTFGRQVQQVMRQAIGRPGPGGWADLWLHENKNRTNALRRKPPPRRRSAFDGQ